MLINKFSMETEIYSVLDIEGNITQEGYKIPLSDEEIKKAHYVMLFSRIADTKMLKWQRQGKMYNFPPNLGEEALQVATAMSMDKQDWFVPAFRSAAIYLYANIPLSKLLLLWRGNETGNITPNDLNFLPFNIPIATQISHATGVGIALNYQNKPNVAYVFIGDGGTAEGEFYEAMNFGSVRNAQTIYCINNNQWAISTPTDKETGQKDIAKKAVAAGIDWIKVDGNDLFASYEAIKTAREYVVKYKKPILVEFMTYRMGPHTTADNPKLYRSAEYEKEQNKKDPLIRLEKWMINNGLLTEAIKAELTAKAEREIEQEYQIMEANKEVTVNEVFDYTYANLDEDLIDQKNTAIKLFGGK